MKQEAVIIIGGGVGPMAGLALHQKIIENTLSDGSDQSHICVHHYSCPALVPDRTAWLIRNDELAGDPAIGMANIFGNAAKALGERQAVAGIPCNTFHAAPIFDRFTSLINKNCNNIRIINMLHETMAVIKSGFKEGSKIGVLSTTGTRQSGVYHKLLQNAGYEAIFVPELEQEALHSSIYDKKWGIKATAKPSQKAVDTVKDMAKLLVKEGAMAVILACTELPLALKTDSIQGAVVIDPVLYLAMALIREVNPEKLAPHAKQKAVKRQNP